MASVAVPSSPFPWTKETTNYARLCRILVDVGPQVLRDTFDAIHPPVGLHTVLGRHPERATLQSLKKKRVLSPTQWGKLYPTVPSSVSSAHFDITLLIVLLRNICGLSPPSTGWDSLPPAAETSKEANIVRLKYYCNAVYGHSPQAAMDDATFNNYWQDISNAILGLVGAGYEADISKLKNKYIDPDTEEHYRQRLMHWMEDEDKIIESDRKALCRKLPKKWKQDEEDIKETVNKHIRQLKKQLNRIEDKIKETFIMAEDKVTNFLDQMESEVRGSAKKLEQGETKEQDDFDPREMIEIIRQLYKRRERWMAPLPWYESFEFSFDYIYTRLQVINKRRLRGTATDQVDSMSKIFNLHEEPRVNNQGEEPRVVLIVGKPGTGKTTYCKRVAYAWAKGKLANEKCFSNFLLVLSIKCRAVQSDFWEAIDDQLLPRDIDDDQRKRFFDFIRHHQSEVLLVLDGLDEVSKWKLPMFLEIIQGRVLPNCRVVVTARHEVGVTVRNYCDMLLEVEGFTKVDVETFIKKHFRENKNLAKQLIQRLNDDETLNEMSRNPFTCALFCLVWEDLGGAFPESRSELYMDIVECVLRRYRVKKQLPENSEDLVELYESQLKLLGSIALKGLLEDNLDFDEKEVGKHIASDLPEFGFLSVQPRGSKLRPTVRYGFLHKSFQEFFAALDLSCKLIKKEISTESIAADRRYRYQLKEVLPFTFGILAARCEETAVNLVRSMATQLNQEEDEHVAGGLAFAFKCINECKYGNNRYDEKLARALGDCLEKEVVDLSRTRIDRAFAPLLANVLKTAKEMKILKLPGSNLGDDLTAVVAKGLKRNASLTQLNWSHNKIKDAGAAALAESLKDSTSLKKLELLINEIGDAGAAALADCLKENTSLTVLELSQNRIGDVGACALAECLKENTSLTELSLGTNNIGDTGVAALAEALKGNKSLIKLDLSANKMGFAGVAALAKCLGVNTSLAVLNLSFNDIGCGSVSLAKHLDDFTSAIEEDVF